MSAPDDATLRTLTGYCLRRANAAATSAIGEVFAAHGLRRTTFSALALVVDHPGLRQSQLAEALAIERPNLVQIVDQLEALGFVERRVAEDDRRAYALQPTDAGQRVLKAAMAAAHTADEAFTAGLTPAQVAALHAALAVIEENATGLEGTNAHDIPRP